MTFRLLHTSDWHLGQHFYGKSRRAEHQKFLTWLLNQVVEHNVDAVVVAGDIFDTGTPPSYAREMYFDFMVNMHQLGCPLIVVAGNHDSVAMLTESKQLLLQLGCYVISAVGSELDDQIVVIKDEHGQQQAVISAVPFIRPRDVIKSQAGQSSQSKQHQLQEAITNHYQLLYKQAQKQADKEVPIIGTGHLTTIGASVSESVRDIYIGTLEAFPASEFPPFNYIALGHIHRHQKVGKSDHIRYCGSPISLSFDESTQSKTVLLAEFEKSALLNVDTIAIPCFQPLAMLKTNLTDLELQVSQLIDEISLEAQQTIWLDVEVESTQYLSDLTQRINQIIVDKPIEVLLVRRAKHTRKQMTSAHSNETLDELTINDVFQTRLQEECWEGDELVARKSRIEQLFSQIVSDVEQGKVISHTDTIGEDNT